MTKTQREPVRCETPGCPSLMKSGRRCPACRVRKCRGSIIDGETCGVPSCGIAHPRVLRWHRFTDETVALCANHAALAGRRPIEWQAFQAEAGEIELLSA